MAKKRTKVLATGVFDILHPGHIFFLIEAKKWGDYLTVLITCDKVALQEKRQTVFNQFDRAHMVSSLKMVDRVVIGDEKVDYCQTLAKYQPDILVLGYNQKMSEQSINICQWKGKIVKSVKYPNKNQSTTNIIRKIQNGKTTIQKSPS